MPRCSTQRLDSRIETWRAYRDELLLCPLGSKPKRGGFWEASAA